MGIELCGKMGSGILTRRAKQLRRLGDSLNDGVSKSFVGKYFKLEARKTRFTTELRAGLATFLTMAYIITVNATILADSGATCSVSDCTFPANQTATATSSSDLRRRCTVEPNDGYQACLSRVKSDLIVATTLSATIGSIAMGVLANLPLGLAPAMGPNAYVAYNLVGFHGSGPMSYQTAMAVVLVEACIFAAISAFGLRAKLARVLPRHVRLACAAGIGLFIAFVGLQAHQGMGLIGPDPSTLVTVTACSDTDPSTGACLGGKMRSPKFWLGFVGFLITSYGMIKEVKGSMIYGILFVTIASSFRDTPVTCFPSNPLGDSNFEYFKRVVEFRGIKDTAGAISFSEFGSGEVWVSLLTLLCVDLLATTGTMYTMAEIGGLVEEDSGRFEGEYLGYIVDAASSAVGSALGVTTTAAYVESAAGMREGGRTGLTAVVVGLCFSASLFFAPALSGVPPWAIGPSLVMVGAMMMRVVKEIEWGDAREAIPAFVTVALMPLTYSISNGVIGGIGVYIALSLYDWVVRLIEWLVKMRRAVAREHNQVSAASGSDPSVEII